MATVGQGSEAAAPSAGKTLALLIKAPTRPSSLDTWPSEVSTWVSNTWHNMDFQFLSWTLSFTTWHTTPIQTLLPGPLENLPASRPPLGAIHLRGMPSVLLFTQPNQDYLLSRNSSQLPKPQRALLPPKPWAVTLPTMTHRQLLLWVCPVPLAKLKTSWAVHQARGQLQALYKKVLDKHKFILFYFTLFYYGLTSEIVLQGLLLKQQYKFLWGMMKMI